MSAEEKNKLDNIFKKGLETGTHAEYDDQHWDNLQQLMDGNKKPRGIIFWLPGIGAVAAMLLLFLGWWLFNPKQDNPQVVVTKPKPVQPAPVSTPSNTGLNTLSTKTNNVASTKVDPPVNNKTVPSYNVSSAPLYVNNVRKVKHQQNNLQAKPNINTGNAGIIPSVVKTQQEDILASNGNGNKVDSPVNNTVTSTDTAPVKDAAGSQVIAANTPPVTDNPATVSTPADVTVKKAKMSSPSKFKPQFGLAMMVSPDINGVGSFKNTQVGANIGVLFSAGITKRLTISTGATYSKKPYATTFDNYYAGYKFKNDPQTVTADCRVLDIPLNVDYKVYSKSKNSLSIGSGLSSYIMLKEKYFYNYAISGTSGPSGTVITNRNRHFLGVLNINTTYEHKLNSKFSIAAQPYLKIPLTDIGNSRVKLQSAGVAVGLRWNINQSITP